jgi:hypothetical protein
MGTATFQSRLVQGKGPVKVGLSPDSIPLRWLLEKFSSKRVALNMIGIALLGLQQRSGRSPYRSAFC